MPNNGDVHNNLCITCWGSPFKEVNSFIDEPSRKLQGRHRVVRHNPDDADIIYRGYKKEHPTDTISFEEFRKVLIFHIATDVVYSEEMKKTTAWVKEMKNHPDVMKALEQYRDLFSMERKKIVQSEETREYTDDELKKYGIRTIDQQITWYSLNEKRINEEKQLIDDQKNQVVLDVADGKKAKYDMIEKKTVSMKQVEQDKNQVELRMKEFDDEVRMDRKRIWESRAHV